MPIVRSNDDPNALATAIGPEGPFACIYALNRAVRTHLSAGSVTIWASYAVDSFMRIVVVSFVNTSDLNFLRHKYSPLRRLLQKTLDRRNLSIL